MFDRRRSLIRWKSPMMNLPTLAGGPPSIEGDGEEVNVAAVDCARGRPQGGDLASPREATTGGFLRDVPHGLVPAAASAPGSLKAPP